MSLTNTQYDAIMRQYNQKQIARQHLISARKSETYQRAPKLAELDSQMASVSLAHAKQLLEGDTGALEGLRSELSDITKEKQQIMESLGYPMDFLSPPYECPDCQDTGYVQNHRCHCFQQASIDLVYAQSNLQSILEEENFDHFSLQYYSDTAYDPDGRITARGAAERAYKISRHFAENFGEPAQDNLLFMGSTGVGKTFLCNCVAAELLAKGHSVIYFSAHQFFEILADNTFGKQGSSSYTNKDILGCDLLIIDDLGTELTNSFTASQFFLFLNERLRNKKSTVISTNLNLSEIASVYSERISSRISNSFTLLCLFGRDIRIQKKLSEKR